MGAGAIAYSLRGFRCLLSYKGLAIFVNNVKGRFSFQEKLLIQERKGRKLSISVKPSANPKAQLGRAFYVMIIPILGESFQDERGFRCYLSKITPGAR